MDAGVEITAGSRPKSETHNNSELSPGGSSESEHDKFSSVYVCVCGVLGVARLVDVSEMNSTNTFVHHLAVVMPPRGAVYITAIHRARF